MNTSAGRLSTDTTGIQNITRAAAARFTEPLPLPPDYDFEADAQNDLKLAALMCAIAQLSKDRGTTITQQLDAWEAG